MLSSVVTQTPPQSQSIVMGRFPEQIMSIARPTSLLQQLSAASQSALPKPIPSSIVSSASFGTVGAFGANAFAIAPADDRLAALGALGTSCDAVCDDDADADADADAQLLPSPGADSARRLGW